MIVNSPQPNKSPPTAIGGALPSQSPISDLCVKQRFFKSLIRERASSVTRTQKAIKSKESLWRWQAGTWIRAYAGLIKFQICFSSLLQRRRFLFFSATHKIVRVGGNANAPEMQSLFAMLNEKLVRAPFLNHSALNNDERATHSRFPFTNVMWRVRGCLTLMLAPFTPSHRHAIFGLRTSSSACLSLHRAHVGRRWLLGGLRAIEPLLVGG